MDRLAKEYPDNLVVIAANGQNLDKPETIKKFAEKKTYSFDFVFAKELSSVLDISSIPYKIVLDTKGNIIDTQTGFEEEGDTEYLHYKTLIEKHKQ